jgi:hypothetical protein
MSPISITSFQSGVGAWLFAGVLACHPLATAFAQGSATWVQDSVLTGPQYANDVYYNLKTGKVREQPRANWHLAFGIAAGSAIYVNSGASVEVYRTNYKATAEDFAAADTAGALTPSRRLFNQENNWQVGAFNTTANPANQFDIGWADYDISTHTLTGDSLYFVRIGTQAVVKLWLKSRASGVYTFTYANADGSNEKSGEIKTADFRSGQRSKYFAYLDLTTGTVLDREPFSDEWDFLFTRYLETVPSQTGPQSYPVTGVKTNPRTRVKEYAGKPVDLVIPDTTGLDWSTSATEIGYDWKNFNGQQFVLTDSLFWLVESVSGSLWKIYFDGFGGSSTGKYRFRKQEVQFRTTSRASASESLMAVRAYPNPVAAGEVLEIRLDDTYAAQPCTAQLVDLTGRVIVSQELMQGLGKVTIPTVPAGLHTLTVTQNGRTVAHQKIAIR